ncbi:MAG TPA: chromate transporter [Candidatus Atopostipes pullistercoris]|uniref:Chromate transporter n=1 Tax=Candidatus Atopostipes pullistercoris TaxID=2838467 RepID=A0A9D2G0F0_9LACT|nr:chromate transporter [Candidatus Atopostipes pullistercoris]
MDKKKTLWKLFISTLYLSAFTFGGGYVIVTLMKNKFVDDYGWISEEEMLNFVAIAQSAPGAIAVNGAIVIGFKLAGFMGVIVSILGTIIPPFIVISLISFAYEAFRDNIWISLMLEGMQAGVGAVVTAVSYQMATDVIKEKDKTLIILMVVAFLANAVFNVNVMLIILTSILIGLLQSYLAKRKETEG